MALIDGYNEPRKQNPNCRPGVQTYLKFLQSTVRGKPGFPVENPEPLIPVEAAELVDGIAAAPEKPKRKRKPASNADRPTLDRDSANLARYARKITGRK
jgi:hypothetical protein